MSQMSLKLNQKARQTYIEHNILYETLDDIALHCGVNPRTIDRDIEKWKSKGGFDRFLEREFFSLYGKEKLQNPSRALDRILMLMMKRMPDKVEASTKNLTIIRMWQPNDSANDAGSNPAVLPVPAAKAVPQRPLQDKA